MNNLSKVDLKPMSAKLVPPYIEIYIYIFTWSVSSFVEAAKSQEIVRRLVSASVVSNVHSSRAFSPNLTSMYFRGVITVISSAQPTKPLAWLCSANPLLRIPHAVSLHNTQSLRSANSPTMATRTAKRRMVHIFTDVKLLWFSRSTVHTTRLLLFQAGNVTTVQ